MNFPALQSLYHRLLLLLPFTTDSFNYDDPYRWPRNFPQCGGLRQSPISIYTHKTIPITLPPLTFELYDNLLINLLKLRNNGHTIEFEVPETFLGEKPFITGGFLRDIYTAESVHFHWGSPGQKGTEHALNGKRYDLEMHIVHKNIKYTDLKEAGLYDDGISVVAVFFKVVHSSNVYYPGLNVLYETLDDLRTFNSTATTNTLITLGSLMGSINRRDFLTYRGSLTTPPCSEAVTWNLFPEVVPISYFELSKFWNILDNRGRPLQNTFRPLQKIGSRKVYRQKPLIWHNNFIDPTSTDNFIDPTSPDNFIDTTSPDNFIDITSADNLINVNEPW